MATLTLRSSQSASIPPADQDDWHVDDPERIVHLIDRLKQGRILVNVALPGGESPFRSAVLEINEAEKFLLLDELTPTNGHKQMRPGLSLRISSRINGVGLSFKTRVEKITGGHRIATYRVTLPTAVSFRERRKTFRIRLRATDLIPFHAECGSVATPLTGEIIDLSTEGCGIMLDHHVEGLETGMVLDPCSIRLPNGTEPTFELDLRTSRTMEHSGRHRIGGRFSSQDPAWKKALRNLVSGLQREYRRTRV